MNALPATIRSRQPGSLAASARPARDGFTLVELLLVVSIITLLATAILPSVLALFASGSALGARNLISAQLTAARAVAIRYATHAGVHVQLADGDPNIERACYSAIVWDDPNDTNYYLFSLAEGYTPRRIKGSIAMGQPRMNSAPLTDFVDNVSYEYLNLGDNDANDFTTFTIVFSPTGSVVKYVAGSGKIVFDAAGDLFTDDVITGRRRLWDAVVANDDHGTGIPGEPGTTALVIFDYGEFRRGTGPQRAELLNRTGRLVATNIYTGQAFK